MGQHSFVSGNRSHLVLVWVLFLWVKLKKDKIFFKGADVFREQQPSFRYVRQLSVVDRKVY